MFVVEVFFVMRACVTLCAFLGDAGPLSSVGCVRLIFVHDHRLVFIQNIIPSVSLHDSDGIV